MDLELIRKKTEAIKCAYKDKKIYEEKTEMKHSTATVRNLTTLPFPLLRFPKRNMKRQWQRWMTPWCIFILETV